jgi:hypothetical protein
VDVLRHPPAACAAVERLRVGATQSGAALKLLALLAVVAVKAA